MRLMIMFDLHIETASQKRECRQFRKSLINMGFLMMQYFVYVRVCVTKQSAIFLENKLRKFLPTDGVV